MVKTPRHSKSKAKSVTIDLDASDVQKLEDEMETQSDQTEIEDAIPQTDPVSDQDVQDEEALADGAENVTDSTSDDSEPDLSESDNTKDVAPDSPNNMKKPSKMPVFAAGLIGAVLTLGGAAGLQYGGYIASFGSNENDGADLEKITALETSLSQLKNELADQADNVVDLSPLDKRLSDLEMALAQSSSGESSVGDNLALGRLTDQVVALEQKLSDSQLQSIPNELSALSDQLSSSQSSFDAQTLEVSALSSQIVQLSDQLAQLRAAYDALSGRMAEAETSIAAPRTDISLARNLAAVSIKSAIDRGGVFKAEFDALVQIDPEEPLLAELEPLASKGVLSRQALIGGFNSVATEIIASEKDPDAETNIMSRLLESATSVVKIRQVGDVEGDTIEAIVARIEARLMKGDFINAQAEWNNLSDAAKSVSQTYFEQVADRIKAEQFADQLLRALPARAQ